MNKRKVAIVGYGRVGKVLALALPAAGYNLAAIVTRQSAIYNLRSAIYNSIHDLPESVDLVILCLRDREIEQAPLEIPQRATLDGGINPAIPGSGVLCHTAGALSAEVLAPARDKGWSVMAFHPLQTFTGDESPELLKGITFGIDGDVEAVKVGKQLAEDLGGVPFMVPANLRREYHLGAVFACNLMAGLVGQSLDLLKDVGMDEKRALEALEPLMLQTVRNIVRKGLPDAITGPVKRGDTETIKKHLELLKERPEAEEIYRILTKELERIIGK